MTNGTRHQSASAQLDFSGQPTLFELDLPDRPASGKHALSQGGLKKGGQEPAHGLSPGCDW
ncbi:hypothetical protein KSD_00390 [Ktedonobacter sp. SOSP1-85]|nr:hypothetical protein KSD_00390 [Ktedonobacter sp. SOSP1-85]